LFLDADVRLSPDGLGRIAAAHAANGVVSVQPYHTALRWYEQNALIFNLVQIGAKRFRAAHSRRSRPLRAGHRALAGGLFRDRRTRAREICRR
jgi:hypothetical protein